MENLVKQKSNENEQLLTQNEAIKLLRVSRPTFIRYRVANKIPFITMGSGKKCKKFYRKDDLLVFTTK